MGPLYKEEQPKTKAHCFSEYSLKKPPNVITFYSFFKKISILMMVMTQSGGPGRRRLLKGSSNNTKKVFNQEGSAMDPIDVEPLNSAPLAALVPYDISKDEFLVVERSKYKGSSPLENQNSESSNLEDNPIRTTVETVGIDIEPKIDLV